MKRTMLRSLVLSLSLLAAIYVANKLPAYLRKIVGTDTNADIWIGVIVLVVIIVLIMAVNWFAYLIKRWRRKGKSDGQ